jgi:hypothetical protein
MNNVFTLADESLVAYYESVRRQVAADGKLGGRRLAGATMKEYANRLKSEMDRRRLHFQPIDWPFPDASELGFIRALIDRTTELMARLMADAVRKDEFDVTRHAVRLEGQAALGVSRDG